MNRRIATSAFALALTFGCTAASHAAVLPGAGAPSAPTTTSVKVKLVSFQLRNDASTPLIIQFGDQQLTIAPGQTSAMKVGEGVQIVSVNAAGHTLPGAILATVYKKLNGSTICVH